MDSTTQATPAPAATQSAPLSSDALAERFAGLWAEGGENGPGAPDSAPPVGQEPAAAQEAHTEPAEGAAPEAPTGDAAPETPEWEDFDAYLTQAQIDRARAKVRVKVDGQEQQVALAEALKAYELSQAGHNRLAEAAKVKEAFGAEKQQAVQAFVQRAQHLEAVGAEMKAHFLAPYEQAVQQAAASGDRGAYAAACYDRDAANTWYTTRLQSIAQTRQQEAQQATQAQLQALPQERERMLTARPEWREPSRLDADHAAMRAYGRSLGFADAELGGVSDHRQLLVLDGAAKMAAAQQAASAALGKPVSMGDVLTMVTEYAKLQASAPEVTKKVAAAPPMTSRPGVRAVAPKDARAVAITAAKAEARKSGYSDDSAAALFEQLLQ